MINKKINRFEIKAKIGKGGMATVFLAQNELGKKAAVKVLHESLLDNEQIVNRFNAEARIMLKLEHPNIRQVYDLTKIDDIPVILMEYLDGLSLKDYIITHNTINKRELINWLPQITDAFRFFHQEGIIHRDIKPANLFITKQNQIKIMDFGIAKSDDKKVNTTTGSMLGTINYMSPEQIINPKTVDGYTDYYSLGISILHGITGELPYNDSSSMYEMQEKIVKQAFPPIPDFVDGNLKNLIRSLCSKNTNQRITNTERLLELIGNHIPENNADVIDATVLDIEELPENKKKSSDDEKAWKRVELLDDLIVFHDFIKQYPESPYLDKAINRVNKLKKIQKEKDNKAWENVTFKNTITEYENYLKKFPDGDYIEIARKQIEIIKEYEFWNFTKKENSKKAYQRYLEKYQEGEFVEEAQKQLFKFNDKDQWEKAKKGNNIDNFRTYLEKTNNKGKHKDEAKARIDEIYDANLWEECLKSNTLERYREYLDKTNNQGKNKISAEKKIVILEEEEVWQDARVYDKLHSCRIFN